MENKVQFCEKEKKLKKKKQNSTRQFVELFSLGTVLFAYKKIILQMSTSDQINLTVNPPMFD